MRWQDIVISVAQIGFVIALLPSIRSKEKPAIATSIMNVILVCTIAMSLLTLRLWFSSFTAFLIAAAWAVLAIQTIKINKSKE